MSKPQAEPATEETPADQPRETTLVDLAVDIGNLVRTVAEVCKMPLGTANSVVKTTLEYHLNKEALALQRASTPTLPFALPPADNEEEE